MSSRDVTVILHPASAIYFGRDTTATGEMSVDQDYLGARGASRLGCAEKTDWTEYGEGEESVRRNLGSPEKFLCLSLSLTFVFRVSSQVGSNEGTDL